MLNIPLTDRRCHLIRIIINNNLTNFWIWHNLMYSWFWAPDSYLSLTMHIFQRQKYAMHPVEDPWRMFLTHGTSLTWLPTRMLSGLETLMKERLHLPTWFSLEVIPCLGCPRSNALLLVHLPRLNIELLHFAASELMWGSTTCYLNSKLKIMQTSASVIIMVLHTCAPTQWKFMYKTHCIELPLCSWTSSTWQHYSLSNCYP